MKNNELDVLNILRGVGALFVIFYHFFIFFFTQQTFSASLLCIEPIELAEPFYLSVINSFPINLGHFGVSFFFLISGFLIPSSLEKWSSLKEFLTHKFFRLWPSYVFCFLIGLLFVFGFFLLFEQSLPYSFSHVLSYILWMRDIFHYPYIDGSVWTLEIQIKFYIFAGIIWYFCKKNFLENIFIISLSFSLAAFTVYILWEGEDVWWLYLIKLGRLDLKYFLFMLFGTCLHSFYQKQISFYKFFFFCSLLLISFLSPLFQPVSFEKTNGYLLGIIIFYFLILVSSESKKERHNGVLRKVIMKISKISYPLYVGHVLPGYTLMYLMIYYELSLYIGIFIALPLIFLIAYFTHIYIEKPFIAFSNKSKQLQHTLKLA